MVAKAVNLGPGLTFPSIGDAESYFGKILADTPIDQKVTSGQFSELKILYDAYCAKTNWPVPSPCQAFFPTYEKQKGYTTKCFGVEFQNGTTGRFSLRKALTAVAN